MKQKYGQHQILGSHL
ncbi:unnamed protein product [Priceomyces carsonii]|nr:unnamed protein product [Priceomyces carsonii]